MVKELRIELLLLLCAAVHLITSEIQQDYEVVKLHGQATFFKKMGNLIFWDRVDVVSARLQAVSLSIRSLVAGMSNIS